MKEVTDDAQRWVSEGDRHIGGDLCCQNGGRYRGQPGEHAEGGAACQREQQVGSKLKQAAANMHLPAALSPSARVAKQLDAIEETLEQYADQFPVNAPVERWKSTLQSLRLMDTMNRSTTGSEHKNRLEKLQTQTEALFNEIFQSLDSGDAQIED